MGTLISGYPHGIAKIERRILSVGVAVEILIVFRDNPPEFWIDPEIIDIAIKRIKNLSKWPNDVVTL